MNYAYHLLILIGIFSTLTISLNVAAGFTGMLSLSHATFYGVGAYATAILTAQYGWGFLPSAGVGMLCAAALAWLASFPILRLKEDAFILVSFGFAIIVYNLLLNLDFTGGPLGVKGIPAPEIFGLSFQGKPLFLALTLLIALFTYLFFRRVTRSPYGTVLKAVRENGTVARVNGHDALRFQRSVFTVTAAFAALAGSLMASTLSFIEPKLFDLMPSVTLLIMVIVGGMANLRGSVLGAAILLLIPEILRFAGIPDAVLGETQQMIYGALLVLMMFLRPQGLMGEYKL